MKNEKNDKKGLKIYCIYFENPEYRSNSSDDPKEILKEISNLGGTGGKYYSANSLPTLIEAFIDVSKAIELNFKLAFSK